MEILLEHIGKGFIYMLLISMPCVLVAAGIGLIIGILQAVTQVQEQTIAAAPKILAVFLTIMIFGGFFTRTLINYFLESTNLAFNVVTHEDNFVLPANASLDSSSEVISGKVPSIKQVMKNPTNHYFSSGKKEKLSYGKANKTSDSSINLIETKKMMGR
jgi:flagellar biosynthesis protein FliQ